MNNDYSTGTFKYPTRAQKKRDDEYRRLFAAMCICIAGTSAIGYAIWLGQKVFANHVAFSAMHLCGAC